MLSNQVSEQVKSDTDIENLWNTFKCGIHKSVEKNVPSKMCKSKYNLPWVNKKLKRSLKTKARLHRQAKKSGKRDRYRSFQRECKNNLGMLNGTILLFKKALTIKILNHFGNMLNVKSKTTSVYLL